MYLWIDNIILGIMDNCNTNNVYELYDYLEIQIHKLESSNILIKEMIAFITEILMM
jgi:hypothetical protein